MSHISDDEGENACVWIVIVPLVEKTTARKSSNHDIAVEATGWSLISVVVARPVHMSLVAFIGMRESTESDSNMHVFERF